MIQRLVNLMKLPLSRQLQYVEFVRARLVMVLLQRWRLRHCGRGSVVLKPLFWMPERVSIGDNVIIWPGCRIEGLENEWHVPAIEFGDGVSVQQNCHITAASTLSIGAGTTILAGVVITDIDHRYDAFGVNVSLQPITVARTEIGPNCFIGAGARILAGTRLGEHCVVGTNAVVRGTYPAGSVLAGIPARVVKRYDAGTKQWVSQPDGGPNR
jgi:acetyltransferase-like isoleucine patch superfamily enzyme